MANKGRFYPQARCHWKTPDCFETSFAPFYGNLQVSFDAGIYGLFTGSADMWSLTDDPTLPTLIWEGDGQMYGVGDSHFTFTQNLIPRKFGIVWNLLVEGPQIWRVRSEPYIDRSDWSGKLFGANWGQPLQKPPGFGTVQTAIDMRPFRYAEIPPDLLPWT